VLENSSDSAVVEDECRVCRMSRAFMCRLRYDSVEVVQTLNINKPTCMRPNCTVFDMLKFVDVASGSAVEHSVAVVES